MLNRQTLYDVVGVAGVVAIIVGCGMIYLPAGIIVGGVAALATGILGARGE